MMVDDWGVTYCKNCGHESHCGCTLRKKVDQHVLYSYIQNQEIEVCKSCRCEKCKIPDWG